MAVNVFGGYFFRHHPSLSYRNFQAMNFISQVSAAALQLIKDSVAASKDILER